MADRYDYDPEAFDYAMPRTSTDPKQAGEFVRGAKYAPFDLLGAPVDIANLLMGGAGGTKPFLGSEYLIDKYADLGEALGIEYERPTYSTAETAGRIIGGFALDPTLAAGIAPKFAQKIKTRGAGIEKKGSGAAELEAPSSELGPMVREAGAEDFVPLEKRTGEPGILGTDRGINKPLEDDPFRDGDYLPAANALIENPPGMNIGKKGLTGEQYLARLKNQPGVTDIELETSGLASFLNKNKTRKMPLEEVYQYHVQNSPQIEMVDGGAAYVSDQRMFGDESYTAQGKDTGLGGYEEVVFRDKRFTQNMELAPGATHDATHHSMVPGSIGHGRQTSFTDTATGERSTMLEENQTDLWSVYESVAAREPGGRNFVQLTPEKVETFNEIAQKVEDGAQYRTLNDAFDQLDAQKRMLQEIKQNQRTTTADLEGIRDRNFLQGIKASDGYNTYSAVGPERSFARKLKEFTRSDSDTPTSLADKMGKEISLEADLGNVIKQAVIEDTLAISRLSDDQLAKVLKLAADRSLRLAEGSSFKIKPIIRAPLNDTELKQVLDIPEAITGAEEDIIIGASRLVDNVQNEFKNLFETVMKEYRIAPDVVQVAPYAKAIEISKSLLPKVSTNINPKLLRKDAAEFKKLSSEQDLFQKTIDDQNVAIKDAADRVMNIYGDAIEHAAPNRQTAFEYLHYRNDQGKLALDDDRFKTLSIKFSKDPKGSAERGFPDSDPDFTNPLPFKTQDQASRYQLHQMIKKAANDGSTRFYLPDYRDLALKRDKDITDPKELRAYESRYKIPQEKVIKELKAQYPGIDIGTVDVVAPVARESSGEVVPVPSRSQFDSEAEFESAIKAYTDFSMREIPEHDFPMTYIDLKPLQANPSKVRRYAKGGPVDLRSGIGNVFKLYS